MLAIDTETHMLRPEGKVRSHFDVPDLVCISWARDDGEEGLILWDEEGATGRLLDLVGDQTIVMHNAKFDLAVLTKWAPELDWFLQDWVDDGRVLDTMVLYFLRYGLKDRLRSLAAVVQHLFRHKMDKESGARTSFRRGQPLTEGQRAYALEDTRWTLKAAQRLLELPYGALAREEQEFVVAAQPLYEGDPPDVLYSRASAYLAWFLEPEGLCVNMPEVDRRHAELAEKEQELNLKLYESGLMRAERIPGTPTRRFPAGTEPEGCSTWAVASTNPLQMERSWGSKKRGYHTEAIAGKWVLNTRDLIRAFGDVTRELELDPPRTPTGIISLEYDFWKEYSGHLPEALQEYLELSKVRTYKSAFVGPLHTQRPARVYPRYVIPAAETCRWACSRPNQQQQPKKLRGMYGARMIGADYKSLECFTLAHAMAALNIRGPMLEALGEGDLHSFVAKQVGVERQEAKIATFGLGGGMGNKRFYQYMRYQCGLPVTYAQACGVRTRWLRYFTDVQRYLGLFRRDYYALCPHWCSARTWLQDLGFDTDDTWPSPFDLSRRVGGKITCILPSGRVVARRNFSQAANVFFQGTGADVMTQAFVDLCAARVRTNAVVHDSAYSPDLKAGPQLAGIMQKALIKVCPTVSDVAPRPEWETGETFF